MPRAMIDDPVEAAVNEAMQVCPTDRHDMPRLDRREMHLVVSRAIASYLEFLSKEALQSEPT